MISNVFWVTDPRDMFSMAEIDVNAVGDFISDVCHAPELDDNLQTMMNVDLRVTLMGSPVSQDDIIFAEIFSTDWSGASETIKDGSFGTCSGLSYGFSRGPRDRRDAWY